MIDNATSKRLDLIAAEAAVLADDYKNNRLWDGDLGRKLDSLMSHITFARNANAGGYNYYDRGQSIEDR